jgi:hypothetical protein
MAESIKEIPKISNIGKIRLDFQILDSGDPRVILISDFSDWLVIKNMPAYLYVTPPNQEEAIVRVYSKNSTNGLNSLNLSLSCGTKLENLEDGIWNIKVRGGKNGERSVEKYYLKKDELQIELDKEWIKLGIEYDIFDKEVRDSLLYIVGFLEAASSAIRQGDVPKSKEFFKLAQDKMEAFKECKNCI